MTRRIRFTPRTCARGFAVVGLVASTWLAAAEVRAADVPFAPASLISTMAGPASVVSADVDRDGDLDLFTGWQTGLVAWMENADGTGSAWTVRTITTLSGIDRMAAADVDRDGDVDAVVTSYVLDTIEWYENKTGNGAAWVGHPIATGLETSSVVTADLDGDGDIDVVSSGLFSPEGEIRFHENVLGDGSQWALHTIPAGLEIGWLSAADVDGDGDLDLVATRLVGYASSLVAWYENLAGNGSAWAMRTIMSGVPAWILTTGDVDHDGDVDVITAARVNGAVLWYRNENGNGSAWTVHTVSTALDEALGLAAGDVDGDGDLDLLSTDDGPLAKIASWWHENLDGQGGAWATHAVGISVPEAHDLLLADIDGDGNPDIANVAHFGNQIAWFRNRSIHKTACFGPVRTIFAMDTPFGASAADVDRDGDLDVFATSFTGNSDVTWHRNDGAGAAWTPFTVATDRPTFFANVADVDGDGDADAFLGSDVNHAAGWADNVAGGSAWPVHAIGTPFDPSSTDLIGADLDGDGDIDALAAPHGSNLISWQENLDGNGLLWLRHTVATTIDGTAARPVDVDRDGDLDILSGQTPLSWHENVAGNGTAWTTHIISATGAFDALALDLDSDGDLDVVASNVTSSPGVLWHENLTGNGTSWATHTLSTLPDLTSIESRDVDLDGDQDLVGNGGSLGPVWLERTGPGVSFAVRTLGTNAGVPGQVTSADLDGDGAPDMLWASQTGDAVRWNHNGRGQVVLDLLDQVPTTVGNNDVIPILRLAVTHGGRAGDSDLELARLGLLFEEEPGDPLTSAEANALVEELRVYRDANGNGTFDPGIDTLVATVPTLALTGGVQTVAFADGDPNVRVAFGTPQTFFVVAQLTADATQHAPHQFRVTHLALGPSATVAEDRNADIPLTIACPADFASRLVVATPVELMNFTIE